MPPGLSIHLTTLEGPTPEKTAIPAKANPIQDGALSIVMGPNPSRVQVVVSPRWVKIGLQQQKQQEFQAILGKGLHKQKYDEALLQGLQYLVEAVSP